jgi:hypothetical protein
MIATNIELDILDKIARTANSSLDLNERLQEIVTITAVMTQSDTCSIYLNEDGLLTLKATKGLDLNLLNHLKFKIGEGIIGQTAETKKVHIAQDGTIQTDSVPGGLFISFKSLLSVPILDEEGSCMGIICVHSATPNDFLETDVKLLSIIASQISGIVRTHQLFQDLKQKLYIQIKMVEVSQALSSSLINLPDLLNLIAKAATEITNAKGCILRLINQNTGMLSVKATYGIQKEDILRLELKVGEGIAGWVAESGEPLLVPDTSKNPHFLQTTRYPANSILCVPIKGRNYMIGTLALLDKDPATGRQSFSQDDLNLLLALASHASIAIEHARYYERMEELATDNWLRLKELSILYHINTAMRSTVKLDRLLKIILTGVTIGGGLGFNRAILFLVNEASNQLRGIMGVGPSNPEEASRIWSRKPVENKPLVEMITEDIKPSEETEFERAAKKIWIPIHPTQGVLAKTVIEKRAFNVTEDSCYLGESRGLIQALGVTRFATVPLIAQDKVIGVLYVDNAYNHLPITDKDMNLLQMFADQAALAIENATLYAHLEDRNARLKEVQDQLVQSEKLAALGKMAAALAHEIRNPLSALGGFARRLAKDMNLGEQSRKYVDIIIKETTRLEKILEDVLAFSKKSELRLQTSDINTLISETIEVLSEDIAEKNIEVNTIFFTELHKVQVDAQQIKQVFINIINNSIEAMSEKGRLNIVTYNNRLGAQDGVTIEFSDTGGGIPPEILDNIFNPFFTTKHSGTGLGLAIARRIIENHQGTIYVKNRPGKGVTFVINLPVNPPTTS